MSKVTEMTSGLYKLELPIFYFILCFVDSFFLHFLTIWSATDNTAVCMDNLIITIMIKSI